MSQNHSLLDLTVVAAVAITAGTFVTSQGAIATAAGNAFGVARSDGAVGDLVPVDVLGTAIVTAGAAIAAGASVQVAANGQAVTKTTGITVGIALETVAAAGDDIEVYLVPNAA